MLLVLIWNVVSDSGIWSAADVMKLSRESYYGCVCDWRWKWCWGQSSCHPHRPSRVYARSSTVYKALEVRAGQNRSVRGQLLISERPRRDPGNAKENIGTRNFKAPVQINNCTWTLLDCAESKCVFGYHSARGGAKSKLALNIWKMLHLALRINSRHYCFHSC